MLGTSSSESVLPRMLAKMENLGADKSVVGLVIPTGYSFNLDGTCIYLTMAAVFLAQATNTDLSLQPAAGADRHPAPDLQGRGRRHRLGLHRARGDALLARHRAGRQHRADPRRRPLHVRGAGADQPGRQRRRHHRRRQVGGRARRGAACTSTSNRETDQEADNPEAVLVAEDLGEETPHPRAGTASWRGLPSSGERQRLMPGEGTNPTRVQFAALDRTAWTSVKWPVGSSPMTWPTSSRQTEPRVIRR